MEEKESKEFKTGSLVLGAVLVGVGILFLVVNFIPYLGVEKLWPLFMLVPVAILAAVWLHYKERAVGVVLPVVILIFYCGYFLWLNFTSWSHVETTWPNFIIGPGLGFLGLYLAARKWEYLIPSFLLLILAAIFYAAIIENTMIVAALLILMGVLLILKPLIKW
jgi:hypothetical protein